MPKVYTVMQVWNNGASYAEDFDSGSEIMGVYDSYKNVIAAIESYMKQIVAEVKECNPDESESYITPSYYEIESQEPEDKSGVRIATLEFTNDRCYMEEDHFQFYLYKSDLNETIL